MGRQVAGAGFPRPVMFLLPGQFGVIRLAPVDQDGNLAARVAVTGSLLSIIPLIILFLSLQRYWRTDIASGAVKQ